jgi:hypothetical protein
MQKIPAPRQWSGNSIFDTLSLIFDHGETDFLPVLAARILQPRNEDLAIGAGNTVMSNAQGTGARSVFSSRHSRGENLGGRVVINHFDTARPRTRIQCTKTAIEPTHREQRPLNSFGVTYIFSRHRHFLSGGRNNVHSPPARILGTLLRKKREPARTQKRIAGAKSHRRKNRSYAENTFNQVVGRTALARGSMKAVQP